MVSYFPEIYPDETLYSVIARFHRHLGGQPEKQTLIELFGMPDAIAIVDFPGHLTALSRNLPRDRGLTPERLAWRHTLYPYYVAYQPPEVASVALREMLEGRAGSPRLRLGVSASTVPAPTTLRYCPGCHREAEEKVGEGWWKRIHQLPGVVICPSHEVVLRDSIVQPRTQSRHTYIAATAQTCPVAPGLTPFIGEQLEILREIGRRSRELLDGGPEARWPNSTADGYRQALAARGFAKGPRQINQKRLAEEFGQFFSPLLSPPFVPGLGGDAQAEWLSIIACKHTKAFHPLHHILFQLFLDALPVIACPPTRGIHHKEPQQVPASPEVDVRRQRWLQARDEHPTLSRKELASLLVADHAWLRRNDEEWLRTNLPPPKRPRRDTPRVDWPAVDAQLAKEVEQVARAIKALSPPVRVTITRISRHIGKSSVFWEKTGKLPSAWNVLASVAESLGDFRLRRIHWAVGQLEAVGEPLKPWRIRQIAHVRETDPEIEAALDRIERQGSMTSTLRKPGTDPRWC